MSGEIELTIRLNELCELLHISVHRPRMTFKVKNAKVSVGEHNLDAKQATAPAWKLMPAEMSSELDRIDATVGRLLDQYTERFRTMPPGADEDSDATHGFMIRGLYLVPQKHVETLLTQLHLQHDAMRACVRHWLQDTNAFRDKVRQKMGDDMYELVKEQIPDMSTMLHSARIDTVSIPFGMAMSQIKKVGEKSFLADARARTHEMVEQVTQQLIAGPRAEFADAVNSLKDLIERDGKVSTKSVTPIRRAMEKLETFDFVKDAELDRKIKELSQTLDSIVPSEQNKVTATDNGLLDLLRNTANEAVNAARIQTQFEAAAGRGRRAVSLRPQRTVSE